NFVRNVRRQPTQRSKLHLARLVLDARKILQKYDGACCAAPPHRHESRADRAVEYRVAARIATLLVFAPRLETTRELRCVFAQMHVAATPERAQDTLGAHVELPYDAVSVDDQHAVLHVLNDMLADLRHVLEIDLALCCELFAG